MVHENGNRILNSLEQKFGKLAMPQILRWIACFQVLSWGLWLFSPEFINWLDFNRELIFKGQVWRILSWVVFPKTTNVLFMIIAAWIIFLINDSLESAWDSFRLNVYVAATALLIAATAFLPFTAPVGFLMSLIFSSSMFLAFASIYPDYIFRLFFIIPVKVKWLGWVDAAFLVAMFLFSPLGVGPLVLAGMLPYMLVFFPTFAANYKQKGEAAVRRHNFEKSKGPENEPFHECDRCGATDDTNPSLEFRVAADGNEYCEPCLEIVREQKTD